MQRHTPYPLIAALTLAVTCAIQSPGRGTTFTWNLDADGIWEQRTNWTPFGFPARSIDEAVFGRNITRPRTVMTNSSFGVDVAGIQFDSLHTYTIAGAARGGFVNLTSADGPAAIDVLRGTHEFAATVNFRDRVDLDVAAGARLDFDGFVNFANNIASTSGDGEYRFNFRLSHTDVSGLLVGEAGTISGLGTIGADLENIAATVAPGTESMGVLTVVGDYAQEDGGRLRIRVGSGPGVFDRLNVTGAAGLGGRLDLIFADGFVPQLNQSLPLVTAARGVSGIFDQVSLVNAPGQFAADFLVGGTGAELRFVRPVVTNQLSTPAVVANWHNPSSWSGGVVPGTTNVIALRNTLPFDQQVVIASSAFVQIHDLSIQGNGTNAMSLDVQNAGTLSVANQVTIGPLGALQLSGGNVLSNQVRVLGGGTLLGNGHLSGDVLLGDGSGSEAILTPGAGNAAIGSLQIDGDYQQASNGTLVMDVQGAANGRFDSLVVAGRAQLGGELLVKVADFDAIQPGTVLAIIEADNMDGQFEKVGFDITAGDGDGYVSPITFPQLPDDIYHICLSIDGDMNCDGVIDDFDLQGFALALVDPQEFTNQYFLEGNVTGDMDDNGTLDFDDIEQFAAELAFASAADVVAAIEQYATAVPEPSGLALGVLGILLAPLADRIRNRGRRHA